LPDLAEAAAQHARLLLAMNRQRAARRAIERAWRTAPHPDLARIYLEADPAVEPLAKAAALQRLASQNPAALESHLAISEAALNARLWGEARRHLGMAIAAAPPGGPSRRLCLMMARLEDSEAGDPKAARQWLEHAAAAPPDPCYVCDRCNVASTAWQPVCRECLGFDTFTWRVPEHRPPESSGSIEAAAAPLMLPGPPAAMTDQAGRNVPSALAGP
jgi:HemY protein